MEENEIINKQNMDLRECLSIMEVKAEGLEQELTAERRSKEALQAELNGATKEHIAKKRQDYLECHDQVDSMLREQCWALEDFNKKIAKNFVVVGPLDIRKVNLDALTEVDMSELGFHGRDFSSASFNVVTESFFLAYYVGSYDFSPVRFSMTVGSYGLTNYVKGCGFSPVGLSITARSFSLTNYIRGCSLQALV
ncbi:hypothetical protein GOBAR_AA26518 [Gossypium barbadense]|uniref:Uncharacterized protein n=1 Tax=Gossypium barbadense TaxID=3634 RepID=A0A2P5WSS9_GOSBA|nr:hypothetical protein GOBAR_AA26518 [Gossypium barbadense]